MRVLGIETTCDESAASVVASREDGGGDILSNEVMSQIADHAAFGGVVPEIAARAHVEVIDRLVERAVDKAGLRLDEIDGIAAAAGPGLVGGIMVGLTTAKALALALRKPLVAVNHLEGHALTARLTDAVPFPYLLLLVSGGHTQLIAVRGIGDYRRLGTTVDDAVGEAFDKTAKLLGLPYPGGPSVERAAETGDPARFPLPRPMLGRAKPDFSLSGLKTAVRLEAERAAPLKPRDVSDSAPPSRRRPSTSSSTGRAPRCGCSATSPGTPTPSWWRAASPRTCRSAAPSCASPARAASASSCRPRSCAPTTAP